MPMSAYVRSLRERVGHELLLLPGVTAVIRERNRFLLAKQRDLQLWSLIGGSVEPGEAPREAVAREVAEEIGVSPTVGRIVGAYGGAPLQTRYPNGDEVAYVTVAYECVLPSASLHLDASELLDVRWVSAEEVTRLERLPWIDGVIADAGG